MAAQAIQRTVRDPRLDFFRGLAMFIIFIAHTPRDFWALWIPARFGFSDATETFVFCSGMASAIAFGAIFRNRGLLMGTARIVHRVWQVYWAHIGLFFAVLLLVTAFDQAGIFKSEYFSGSYVSSLNLKHFYTKTPELVIGLFTLTYVPNYFDILPMYLVILAMIPIVMGLSRISLWAVAAFVLAAWAAGQYGIVWGGSLQLSGRALVRAPVVFQSIGLAACFLYRLCLHEWLDQTSSRGEKIHLARHWNSSGNAAICLFPHLQCPSKLVALFRVEPLVQGAARIHGTTNREDRIRFVPVCSFFGDCLPGMGRSRATRLAFEKLGSGPIHR